MSYVKYMVVASVIAAASSLVAGATRQALVADVADRAMCPIKIEINDNPDRVPQIIKYLRCADSPNTYCAEKQLADGCCKGRHGDVTTQCVELYDYVTVKYKNSPNPDSIKVPVGCSCVIEDIARPGEVLVSDGYQLPSEAPCAIKL